LGGVLEIEEREERWRDGEHERKEMEGGRAMDRHTRTQVCIERGR